MAIFKTTLNLLVIVVFAFSCSSNTETTLDEIINSEHRKAENVSRDKFRNPLGTLTFFGIKNDMNIVEITPGRGWYTEILAPYLKKTGKLNAAIYAIAEDSRPIIKKLDSIFREFVRSDNLYSDVNIVSFDKDQPTFGENNSADMVLTFRNIHNWAASGTSDDMFKGFYNVLKPGGILGVVEHQAKSEISIEDQISSGYMTEKAVLKLAEENGFEFVERSDINFNEKDSTTHINGVWTLLPNLRGLPEDKKKDYASIGESHRMTLKFVKPK